MKMRFFNQRHPTHDTLLDLNHPRHEIPIRLSHPLFDNFYSTTSKSCSAVSTMVRPRPGTSSSRSMKPSFAFGSPANRYQKSSFPTSTSTMGKYSAIGEFRLAMTM